MIIEFCSHQRSRYTARVYIARRQEDSVMSEVENMYVDYSLLSGRLVMSPFMYF